MKPKAEFYDQVTDSTDAIDIGTVAKVLNIEGFGRNKLFDFLRDMRSLCHLLPPLSVYSLTELYFCVCIISFSIVYYKCMYHYFILQPARMVVNKEEKDVKRPIGY